MALVATMAINATVVEFGPADFEGQGVSGTGGQVTADKDGVTFSCNKGFGDQYGVRCYKNSVVEISSSVTITKISFEFNTVSGTTYNGGLDAEITVGETVWTNTMASQGRFAKVTVELGGEPTPVDVVELTVNSGKAVYEAGELSFAFETDKAKVELNAIAHEDPAAINGNYKAIDFYEVLVDGVDLREVEGFDGNLSVVYVEKSKYNVNLNMLAAGKRYVIKNQVVALGEFADDNNVVSSLRAAELGYKLTDASLGEYKVYGYIAYVVEPWTDQYKNMTFFMADNAQDALGAFEVYRAKTDVAFDKGDLVCVTAKITNFKGIIETTGNATIEKVASLPEDIVLAKELQIIKATPEEAYAEGLKLENTTPNQSVYTDDLYLIEGYCTGIKDAYSDQYKNESWYMGSEGVEKGDLQIFRGKPSEPLEIGDKVVVMGRVVNYCGNSKDGGTYNNIQLGEGTPAIKLQNTGVNNTVEAANAVKTLENGQLVIERAGIRYNVMGARL